MCQVELMGLDEFDPSTMQTNHRAGDDAPVWFLDSDYNELCFHVSQAFFPSTSAPFEAGEHGQIAVKVIDDRGNELMVVKKLEEAS